MNLITDVLVPGLVFFVMMIVGTGMTVDDLRRVMVFPRAVITGTIGQIVLLPVLAVLFVRLTTPPELIGAGLLLLVTCPGGAVSNTYSYLARANVALSVTLTAFTSALSVLTLPIAMGLGFRYGLGTGVDIAVPVKPIVAQLLLLLLTPTAIGMAVRRRFENFVERSKRVFQASAWVAVIVIVAYVFWDQRAQLSALFGVTILYAVGFTFVSMALGLLVSQLSGCSSLSDRFVMTVEFTVRNLPIATLVGVSALGRPEFVVFSGAVFFAQTPILIAAVVWMRRTREMRNAK